MNQNFKNKSCFPYAKLKNKKFRITNKLYYLFNKDVTIFFF